MSAPFRNDIPAAETAFVTCRSNDTSLSKHALLVARERVYLLRASNAKMQSRCVNTVLGEHGLAWRPQATARLSRPLTSSDRSTWTMSTATGLWCRT